MLQSISQSINQYIYIYMLRVVHKVLHCFLSVTLTTQQKAGRLGFQMQQDGCWIVPSARDPAEVEPFTNPALGFLSAMSRV